MSGEETRHRLVMLGAGNVGKSAIVSRFLNGSFPETYKPTVEDLHCRDFNVAGKVVKVDIMDTAGDRSFPAMRRLSISTGHGFILVFAMNCRKSFEEIKQLWEEIKELRSNYQDLPCVIVGNKTDLTGRQVTLDDVHHWALPEEKISVYVEASAKDNSGIASIFQKLLEQANIPQQRQIEPLLKRRLSTNSASISPVRERLKSQEASGKLGRSRSLIRRATRPKVKHSHDPNKNDCVISWAQSATTKICWQICDIISCWVDMKIWSGLSKLIIYDKKL